MSTKKTETSIVPAGPSAIVGHGDVEWTRERVELVKRTITPQKISDDEFALFMEQAKRSGLDPLLKQAFCVPRRAKLPNGQWAERFEFQPSEAGMLARAAKFPNFRGITAAAVYAGDKCEIDPGAGVVHHTFNPCVKRGALLGAWARLETSDGPAIVKWLDFEAYVQAQAPMWQRIPATMIAKCAKVAALRDAYPEAFGGLYIAEEMPPPGGERAARPARPEPAREEPEEAETIEPFKEADAIEAAAPKASTDADVKALEDRLMAIDEAIPASRVAEVDKAIDAAFERVNKAKGEAAAEKTGSARGAEQTKPVPPAPGPTHTGRNPGESLAKQREEIDRSFERKAKEEAERKASKVDRPLGLSDGEERELERRRYEAAEAAKAAKAVANGPKGRCSCGAVVPLAKDGTTNVHTRGKVPGADLCTSGGKKPLPVTAAALVEEITHGAADATTPDDLAKLLELLELLDPAKSPNAVRKARELIDEATSRLEAEAAQAAAEAGDEAPGDDEEPPAPGDDDVPPADDVAAVADLFGMQPAAEPARAEPPGKAPKAARGGTARRK